MFKTEQELMEELMESIFSGNVDSDDSEEKDESTEEETEEKSEKSESEESSEETKDEDEGSEEESEESDSDSDEDSEDSEDESDSDGDSDGESDGDFGGDSEGDGPAKGGPFTSKIRSLQKQYNDLLVDAFEKYAPECIEDALDETESAFGENIEDILQNALDKLKAKIMGDLGVEGTNDLEGMMPPAAMGSFDPAAGADKPMEIQIDKVG